MTIGSAANAKCTIRTDRFWEPLCSVTYDKVSSKTKADEPVVCSLSRMGREEWTRRLNRQRRQHYQR